MASPEEIQSLTQSIEDLLRTNNLSIGSVSLADLTSRPFLGQEFSALVRKWLIAKNVSESQAYKASLYVLINALRGGERYVAKMRESQPTRVRRPRDGFEGIDLGEILDVPLNPIQPNLSESQPQNPNSTLEIPSFPPNVDENSIARAAEKVLSKALEKHQAEVRNTLAGLATGIQDRLGQALNTRWTEAERHFAERTKGLVSETQAMILDLAARQIPREIIVKTNSSARILPTEIRHEAFDRILRWLLAGEHVYIVGPAGTGKTHMAKQLAAALGKTLFLPGQALSKYDISGYKGPTGEYFGTVVRDALEQGGLLFVDEGDMWAAAALGFLNAPLANGWCAFPDKTIEIHPDFQCMIAANTFGRGATQEYIGRNPLDAASVDRFAFVTVDYDEDMEKLLYGNGPWVQYIHRVRAATQDLKLRHVISTRAIQRVLRGLQANLSVEDVCFSSLWRGLDRDTIAKIKLQAGEPPRVLKPVPTQTFDPDDLSEIVDLSDGTNS